VKLNIVLNIVVTAVMLSDQDKSFNFFFHLFAVCNPWI